ncbi:MAG: tRNA threonylcarbamoyladenosine dehydratase [Rhodoferax sp.]|nr:tRNA threonylcarbamoyladenosine dehydratase [Rhodoferax sp.]
MLTMPDLGRRFSGVERLYGIAACAVIRDAHVAVIGIGGVGSWAVEALARSGVGKLTLIDMDHIAESNINRQVHATTDTVGMAKATAMALRVETINPGCALHCIDDFVTPQNWPAILPDGVDAVIDCCDQVRTKTAVTHWARQHQVCFVTVGAAGGKRHAHKVEVADMAHVSHDPLLAKIRYNLRRNFNAPKAGKNLGVSCIFSRESVQASDSACATTQTDATLNCHGYGSLVSVTATFGLCAAGWIIEKISTSDAIAARMHLQSLASVNMLS